MRGKVAHQQFYADFPRITPAYAGKSFNNFRIIPLSRDHPRLCGEKKLERLVQLAVLGSPPPMRGKVARFVHEFPYYGITPAYAGKS